MSPKKSFSKEQRENIIQQYHASGLAASAFATQHNISTHTLKNWIYQFNKDNQNKNNLSFCKLTPVVKVPTQFIKVILPNGCVIEIPIS